MDRSSLSHPCLVCGRPTTLWCGRCQDAWYCSSDHMRSDWPRHRSQCQRSPDSMDSSMVATPSSAESQGMQVSGILFLAGEDRPRIVNIRCRPVNRPSGGVCPVPFLQPYFTAPPESVVLTQGLNNELLRFPLHIFYSPDALASRSPVNRAIHHITSGAAPKPWCGTVVVLKFSGSRRQGYTEAGANDLPALSAYFLSYQ